jgi:hypothetical protein
MKSSKTRAKEPAPKAAPAHGAAPPLLATEEVDSGPDDTTERIFSRPDGWYWLAPDGRQEIGPFATLAEAQADMDSGEMSAWAPDETLAEAESEIGVADWIDPESGELAEGQSPPRLSDE